MNTRPSLLFLCQTLPYPVDSGVAIRTFNVLRILSQAFDITALCFYRRKGGGGGVGGVGGVDPTPGLAKLSEFCEVEAFPVPQEYSVARLAWNHVQGVARDRVYAAFSYASRRYSKRVEALLGTRRFDLAHVDCMVLCRYFAMLEGLPVVSVHHNVESALLSRRAGMARGWRRAYLLHQARLMEREERRWCSQAALNVVVSEADRAQLQTIVPDARCTVLPNGVDTEEFRPGIGAADGMIYVGEMGWFPNQDALEYFCAAILPRLRAAGVHAPVRWVGRASDEARRSYQLRHGVELTGYVPDIRPLVRDAACYVVPLRVGGGTRVKILDAWAMGKAVVSTSIGCEGLAVQDGRNILIRDDPDEFAQAVRAVLQDATLRHRLGDEGRRTVEERYGWDNIGAAMLRAYAALLPARRELRHAVSARG